MSVQSVDERGLLGVSMVEEIRRNAEHRLRQIEPLLEEARRLREVLEVLERRTAHERAGEPESGLALTNGASCANDEVSEAAQSRAARGANKRVILQLVGEHPGIRAGQIAELTGLKRTVVASTVSRLKRQGVLVKHELGGVSLPKLRIAG